MAKNREKEPATKEEKPVAQDKRAKKKQDKNKKPNIFVRMGRRLKETFGELKRVTWPSFGKAVKATGVVLVIVLIFTVIVTGVNYGLNEILVLMTKAGA